MHPAVEFLRPLLLHDAPNLYVQGKQIPARSLAERNQAHTSGVELLGQSPTRIIGGNDHIVPARSQLVGQDDQLAFRASDIQLSCQEQNFQETSLGLCDFLLLQTYCSILQNY